MVQSRLVNFEEFVKKALNTLEENFITYNQVLKKQIEKRIMLYPSQMAPVGIFIKEDSFDKDEGEVS